MDLRAPDKIEYWTGKIKDFADVRLFYYHLLIDLDVWSFLISSVHETTIYNDRRMFSDKVVSDYNKLLKDSFEISGIAEFILDGIWSELEKWVYDNNDPIKRMPVISDSTGEVVYEAGFKSASPLMSVLFAVDNSSGNKQYKKVGYGTIKYMAHPHEAEQFYAIYDNELKKYFDGVITKSPNEELFLTIGFHNAMKQRTE